MSDVPTPTTATSKRERSASPTEDNEERSIKRANTGADNKSKLDQDTVMANPESETPVVAGGAETVKGDPEVKVEAPAGANGPTR
jgi:hypothetical protein